MPRRTRAGAMKAQPLICSLRARRGGALKRQRGAAAPSTRVSAMAGAPRLPARWATLDPRRAGGTRERDRVHQGKRSPEGRRRELGAHALLGAYWIWPWAWSLMAF